MKKAAGVGRQLCSSMVDVRCSAPGQQTCRRWTHNTHLPTAASSLAISHATRRQHELPLVANSINTEYDCRLSASRLIRTPLTTGPSPAQNDHRVAGQSPQLRRAPGALDFGRHMTSLRAVPMSTGAPSPLGILDFAQSNLAKGGAGRLLSVNDDSRRPRFMSSWCSREDHRLGYDVSFPGRGGRGSG